MKNHKVYDTVSKDKKSYQPSEEHIQIKKNTAKSEIELENIEKESKHLIKGKTEIHEVELVELPAVFLFCSVFFMFLLMKLTGISAK